MTPFYFGDSKSPLFGALSEPPVSNQRQHAVLLCPPIGHEHVRSHWALRQLATSLARDGFHVLRFDWFGCGDSGGTLADTSVDHLVEDAGTAAQELRDATGIRRLSMVGLRLGAAIASLAAPDIEPYAMVLWDPVANGSLYTSRLGQLQRDVLSDTKRFWYAWPNPARDLLARFRPEVAQRRIADDDERIGFRMPAALLQQIAKLEASQLVPAVRTRISLVTSRDDDGSKELATALEASGASFEDRVLNVKGSWDDATQIEELYLPGETSQVIVSLIAGSA